MLILHFDELDKGSQIIMQKSKIDIAKEIFLNILNILKYVINEIY